MNKEYKNYICEYATVINEFGNNSSANAWLGSFLHNKDRFHSPFFETFFTFKSQKIICSPYASLISFSRKLALSILKWIYHFGNSMFRFIIIKKLYSKKKTLFDKKKYSLIKSFCYKNSISHGFFFDPFFGHFTSELKSRGIDSLTLVDGLGLNAENYKDLVSISGVVPYQAFNCFYDYPMVFLEVLSSLFNIPNGEAVVDGVSFKKLLKRQYYCEIFNPILLNALLMTKSISRILKKVKVDSVYMTYENINWERLFIKSVRLNSPNTTILGFQHAAISLACTNYFITADEEKNSPIPDYIITTGEAPARIIRDYSNIKKTPVISGCSFRLSNESQQHKPTRSLKKALLVALDGSSESLECIQLIISQIDKLKNWEIILRPHPIFPISSCLKGSDINLNHYSNIVVSKANSIIDDLKNCSIVLYRGSTVAFEAIRYARPIIHLKQSELINYDPLYELDEFKQVITIESSIIKSLNKLISLTDEEYQSQLLEAQSYVNSYFEAVSNEKLEDIIRLKND